MNFSECTTLGGIIFLFQAILTSEFFAFPVISSSIISSVFHVVISRTFHLISRVRLHCMQCEKLFLLSLFGGSLRI